MKFEFAKYTEVTDLALKLRPSYLEEGSFLLERNMIPKNGGRSENLSLRKLKEIILEDELENWDLKQGFDEESLIDLLDSGFGILNRKKTKIIMKEDTKRRLNMALTTASEYIRSMGEVGVQEGEYELYGEEDEKGMEEFFKACEKASKMIEKLSNKYLI